MSKKEIEIIEKENKVCADLIGKRVRVQIGGNPPEDDNEGKIIGEDTTVYVSENQLHKYHNIVGEQVTVSISPIDEPVQQIMTIIGQSSDKNKEKIVDLCKEILNESNQANKMEKVRKLISLASDIASIASIVLQLKSLI